MATTNRSPIGSSDASTIAAACREAEFVRIVARADGDAIAAAGTLAAVCSALERPFHCRIVRTRTCYEDATESLGDGAIVLLGLTPRGDDGFTGNSWSVHAYNVATDLGLDPDPALTIAGHIAAGGTPTDTPSILEQATADRRSGISIPTPDLAEGLAHSTLFHAAFSGDPSRARSAVAGLDGEPDRREAASLLALSVVGHPDASEQAASAVERALRPHVGGPFETLGGYADVLCGVARAAPGIGLGIALDHDVKPAALDAWRAHARSTHSAIRSARTARYDGLLVARVDGPVEPTAQLLANYRSPEPIVLAVSDHEGAGAAINQSIGSAIERAADAAGGSGLGRGQRGYGRFESAETFIDMVREAL